MGPLSPELTVRVVPEWTGELPPAPRGTPRRRLEAVNGPDVTLDTAYLPLVPPPVPRAPTVPSFSLYVSPTPHSRLSVLSGRRMKETKVRSGGAGRHVCPRSPSNPLQLSWNTGGWNSGQVLRDNENLILGFKDGTRWCMRYERADGCGQEGGCRGRCTRDDKEFVSLHEDGVPERYTTRETVLVRRLRD